MPDQDAEARRGRVLAAMKSPAASATRELIDLLGDDDPLVREWAIEALTRRKDRATAVDRLLERLRDPRSDVRWYAARALGKLGKVGGADDAVPDALIEALSDPDEYVRCFAAWALGVLDVRDAIPRLRERLLQERRVRRGLEEQSIGVALARLDTPRGPTSEPHQTSLFEGMAISDSMHADLPRTRSELLKEELLKTAQSVFLDRRGGADLILKGRAEFRVQYFRSECLKQKVLAARGKRCQLCNFTFRKADGEEYGECHHIEPVSQGGPDHEDNLLVLCPNHHKELHLATVAFPGGKSRPESVCINGETIPVRWGS